MTDEPKVVANETKETSAPQEKKPEVVGPTPAATPIVEPTVAKK